MYFIIGWFFVSLFNLIYDGRDLIIFFLGCLGSFLGFFIG